MRRWEHVRDFKRFGFALSVIAIIILLSGCTLSAGPDQSEQVVTATLSTTGSAPPPTLVAVIQTVTATITPIPTATAMTTTSPTATPAATPTVTATVTETVTETAETAIPPTYTAAAPLSQVDIDATVVTILEATNAAHTATAAALPTATSTATLTLTTTITPPPSLTPPPTAIPPTRTHPGPPTVIPFDDGSGGIIPGTGSTTITGSSPVPGVDALPHTLYYLSDAGAVVQVWRLQIGLSYPEQITFSPTGVREFDVAPDGTLAYTTPSGEMVIGGAPLLPPANPDGTLPHVTALAWSPDGSWLAYTLVTPGAAESTPGEHPADGVWQRSTSTGTTNRLQATVYATDSTQRFFTGPIEWRPDGSDILIGVIFATIPAYSRITPATNALDIVPGTETHDPAVPVTARWTLAGDAIIAAGAGQILRIDPTTGTQATLIAPSDGFHPQRIALGSDGTIIFSNQDNSGAMQIYTVPIQTPTGILTTGGSLDFLHTPAGLLVVIHEPAEAQLGTIIWFDVSGIQHNLTPLTGLVGSPQWGPTFKAGDRARVHIEGDPLNVRSTPGGEWITSLTTDVQVTILAGPHEQDGYRWWQIQAANGVTGWAVESVTEEDGSRLQILQPVPK